MDKALASGRYQKPASGLRVPLIPATPRQEPPTPSSSSSSTTDSTQSPATSPSDSQSGSPRGVMRRVGLAVEIPYPFTYQATNVRDEEIPPSAPNSLESLDETASLSDTQAMIFTSSSSHDILADTGSTQAEGRRIYRERSVGMEQVAAGTKQAGNLVYIVVIDSEEDEEEMKGSPSQTSKQGVAEIASEAIREMQEFDRKRKGKMIESSEGPALATQDDSETGDEEVTVSAKWKRKIEETVDGLVAENATQRTLMKEQKEQLIKVVDLVGRMISWMEEKSDSAHQRTAPAPTPREDD